MKILSLIASVLLVGSVFAQSPEDLILKADSLYKKRAYDQAQPMYQSAFQSWVQQDSVEQAIYAGIQVAECDRKTRKRDQALLRLDSLLEQFQEGLDPQSLSLAAIYHKKGANYYNLYEFPDAIHNFQQALDIRIMQLDSNARDIINGYHTIGACHQYRGDYQNAARFLEQAVQLQGSPPADKRLLFQSYTELARAYSKSGEHAKALEYFQAIVAFRQQYYADEPWLIASAYNDLVAHFTRMEQGGTALEYGQKALDIYNGLDEKYEEDYLKMANIYQNMAIAQEFKGDTLTAIEFYEAALQLHQKYNEPGSSEEGSVYGNLGSLIIPLDRDKSKKYLQKAIEIQKAQERFSALGDAYIHSGDLDAYEGNYQEATVAYQAAINTFLPEWKGEIIDGVLPFEELVIGDKIGLLRAYQAKAVAYWDGHLAGLKKSTTQTYLETAHAHFEAVDRLVDLIRQDYQFDLSKQYLSQQLVPVYEKAILAALSLYETQKETAYLETAYRYLEKSKSLTLLEAVRNSKAKRFAGIPEDLIEQTRQLKLELLDLDETISEEQQYEDADLSYLNELQESRLEKRQQLADLNQRFEEEFPTYYQLKIKQEQPSVQRLRDQYLAKQSPDKGKEKAIIEYFDGDEYLITFLIKKDDIQVFQHQKTEADKQALKDLLESLTAYHLAPNPSDALYERAVSQLVEASYRTYEFVFWAVHEAGLPEELIIIPDGQLYYLPFELLLQERPADPLQLKSHAYLLNDYQISYQYSAAMWLESRQNQSKSGGKMLAIAPTFDPTKDALNPLPYSQEEVDAILTHWPGQSLLGKAATSSAFLQRSDQFPVIHLATHAQAPQANEAGFLAFAYENGPGRLFLKDLYNYELPCDMMVLSACETGIGTYQRGEGLLSLGRGLTYAGARSLITSYWKVDDAKTALLMEQFYVHLKAGMTKDAALRAAKLNYLANQRNLDAHPFYWAAFVSIGNMDPISTRSGWPFQWLALLLIPVGFWFFWQRSRA
ncbi:MAG: CHAT domain-containing tetratricopeptide repeat protein [Bacteroidota bacterium]